jgi:hypothetical protein
MIEYAVVAAMSMFEAMIHDRKLFSDAVVRNGLAVHGECLHWQCTHRTQDGLQLRLSWSAGAAMLS